MCVPAGKTAHTIKRHVYAKWIESRRFDWLQLRHDRRTGGETIANVLTERGRLEKSIHVPIEPKRLRLGDAPLWAVGHSEFPTWRHRTPVIALPQQQIIKGVKYVCIYGNAQTQ